MSYLVINNIKTYQMALCCGKSLIACISNEYNLIQTYLLIQIHAYKTYIC